MNFAGLKGRGGDILRKDIFIFSDGALKRENNTIKFYCDDKKRFLPVEDMNSIYAFGELDINKKLLELLSQKEILLHYFNYYGYYMGTFYPREHLNSGYMILRQATAYEDGQKRLQIAKSFVRGSMKNIRQVLKYYNSRGIGLSEEIDNVDMYMLGAESAGQVNELMGIEGNAREMYYSAFDKILGVEGFEFEKRTRRPPQNYLNTLISFGNSLMYTTVLGEIYKTHLDPRIGYLHTTNFRRFSLNLDVAEIFKPVIIDRIIFTLVKKKMITKKDFTKETEGLVLREKAKKAFVQAYDERLKQTIKVNGLDRNVSYKRLIRMELYKLEKHLMGEKAYSPFISRW